MAQFDIAYRKYILPNEGGYANVATDKGGETYAGIARNFFPNWQGWTYIDFVKRTDGPIKHNAKFPSIQWMVDQFYRDWWNEKRFGEINSQEVANLLFDYNIHSSTHAIKAIQQLVGVTADGAMGPKTIAAINKADPAKLHDALKEQRRQFLDTLSKKPGQEIFREGWLARVANFPSMVASSPTVWGTVLVLSLVAVGIYYFNSNRAMG